MQQLDLDFSKDPERVPTKMGTTTPVLQKEVGKKVNASLNPEKKEKYSFEEKAIINGKPYSFKISDKIKEGAYAYNKEKGGITDITFRLIGEDREYRFKFGISEYKISGGGQARYHDDSLGDYLENIFIGYIQKLDGEKGGARFVNGEGKAIENFDYFRYLFGRTPFHHILMPILKRVVLDIENKRSQSQEK